MERTTDHKTDEKTPPIMMEHLPSHLQPMSFRQEREVRVNSRAEDQRDAWKDYLAQSEGVEV